MARYRVLKTSFISNKLVNPDQIIEYTGEASDNLELVGDEVGAPGVEAEGGFYQPKTVDDLV